MGGVKLGWVLFGPRQGKSQQLRCSEGTHAHDTHVATWSFWLGNHPGSTLWVKSLGIGAVFDLSTLNLGVLTLDLKSCWENRSFDSHIHIHAIWTKPSYAIVLCYHFGPDTINIYKSYQDISESLSWTCQWGRATIIGIWVKPVLYFLEWSAQRPQTMVSMEFKNMLKVYEND